MTFEDGIRSAVSSLLIQMYHPSASVDSLRELKREALERVSREGSPALPIWRKLFDYPDSRFLSLLNDSLRIAIHAIDYEHRMVKKQSD